MTLLTNVSVLTRDNRGEGRYGESHMRTKAEISCMQPQTKEHLKPPKVGRGKKGFFLGPSERVWPSHSLDIGLLASTTIRE